MTIENLPVWPFEPNWASSVTETLEWMTDILGSPTGSEQRRALRVTPRQTIEFSVTVAGRARALLDNLLITYSAGRWYVPLWHDTIVVTSPLAMGVTSVTADDVVSSRLVPGAIVCVLGDTPFDTALVEVNTLVGSTVTFKTGLPRAFLTGARIFRVLRGQLTDPINPNRINDAAASAEVRFQVVEPGDKSLTDSGFLPVIYRGFKVLAEGPDYRSALDSGIERMLIELDNQTSIPLRADTAGRPFTYQEMTWILYGREKVKSYEMMLRYLRGRAKPLWVPTFMQDFRLTEASAANSSTMVVEGCGFTLAGGPRWDRTDILIETVAGRMYRRILGSAMNSDGSETILLDQPFGEPVSPSTVVGISFMTLMRLNQDNVQIDHITDNRGVSTSKVVLRSAPDTRSAPAANF